MARRVSDSKIHKTTFFLVCVTVLCLCVVIPTCVLTHAFDNVSTGQVSAENAAQQGEFFLLNLYDTPLKTVDIDKDSREIKQVQVSIDAGYKLPSPKELSLARSGYYFAGWMTKDDFLRNDGRATYRPGDVVRNESGPKLYAYWKKIPNRTFNYVYDHEDQDMKKRIEEKLVVEPDLVSGQLGELDASIVDEIPKMKFKTPLSFTVGDKKRPTRHVIEKWTCKEVPGWSHNGSELTEEQIKTVIARYKASGHPFDQQREEAVDGRWEFQYTPVNFTFVAHFNFLYRTITFDLNYGDAKNRILAVRKGINDDRFVVKERPEKSRFGYKFVGWGSKPDATECFVAGGPYDLPQDHREKSTINPRLWDDLNGFSFLGVDANVFTPTSDMTLYAIWAPKGEAKFTYAVNDEAGGHVTRKEETVPADGDQEPQGSTAVANEGWAFVRWEQPRYRSGIFHHNKETLDANTLKRERCWHASGTKDQTLKSHISRHFIAHFAKIEYHNVAFSSNVSGDEGALVKVPQTVKVKARHSFQIPHDVPQRNGYRFTNWDTHSGGGGASYRPGDVIDAVAHSITLYAQWIKDTKAKLSYSVNNSERGKVTPAEEIIFASTGSPSGATARPVGNSQFKKWTCNLDPDWESKNPVLTKEEIDRVAKNDAGLYVTAFFTAHFEPTVYKLSFDKGDAVPDKALDTLFAKPGKTVSIPKEIPSSPGRIFVNWNDRIDGRGASYKPGDMITLKEDTTLYAQWTKATEAKFTYVVNDKTKGRVTCSEETISKSGDSPQGSLAVPLEDGYVFKWWGCDISSTWRSNNPLLDKKKIDEVAKDETGAYRTVLFTAYFESKSYKITFKSSCDPTETALIRVPEQGSVMHNGDFTLPTEAPVRDGYRFTFWSTKCDRAGALYEPGSIIQKITHDITLYALWAKDIYKVVVNYGSGRPKTYKIPSGREFVLPVPEKVPSGKMLKGIAIDGNTDDLKQPGDKIPLTKDIVVTYVFGPSKKTVKLSYKVNDPEGGKLSVTEEMVAPNAETVSGTTLTVKDGYQAAGWQVEGSSFKWDKDAGLTLTQKMIDRVAKENELYKNTTFIALVEKETFTITIKEPGLADQTISVSAKDEFELPAPRKIPSGKTLKGIKVNDNDNDLKQPGDKIPAAQNTTITYVFENSGQSVKLSYKVNDPEGGKLSVTEEMVAPNAETVCGTTLTLKDGYQAAGWQVEGSSFKWDKDAGLTLTQKMIDRVAKENELYKNTTFIALVEKETITITIKEPGLADQTISVSAKNEFELPAPRKIPSGKTLKGIKVNDNDNDLKQPGDKIPAAQNTTITYVFENSGRSVKLSYKVSDPEGGKLSVTEEVVAPNAETVCGTTLTLKDGYQAAGWQVEGSSFKWDKDAGLTLTQKMIDRVAKENELYKNTTFIALVEKETFTITIKEPGLADQTISVSAKNEFELPAPRKIPSGKTLKGIKVNDNDNDLKQPGDKIPAAQNTTITYVFENSGWSVKLSYKVSDPEGGTLSVTEEVVAPNAETVCGTTLTLKDGYQAAGWQVEGSSFKWDKDAGLTLTQEMIDRVAKENELYKNTTFIALVEKETFTITIKEPGLADQTISVSAKDEFELPAPRKIPSGKTLKGIKVNDNDNDLKQPGDKIPAAQNTTITYVFENSGRSVKLSYKVSDPEGGKLSVTEEVVAPNAETVCGTTLTLKDGYQAAGWQVEGSSFKWDKDAGLTLTQKMIDRVAKENELYKNTTFIALVEKETFTITIKEPGLADQTISVSAKDEFELPAPRKIPSGKTLKGIKVNDNDNDLKQPGDKIPAAQNTTITYVFENSGRSVKLSYKVSDPEGGKLSVTEEVVAPNAETVCGTTLTLKDGYQAAGWQVEGSSFKWDKDAGLTLTQEMIDRVAKENELYKNTTFIALVEKETFTITIKEPGLADQTISVSAKDEFELPAPRKIPSGKTLKGIKVNDNDNDLKQPGDKIPAAQNTTITYVFENSGRSVKLSYKVSDPEGGKLSVTEEVVAPNAETVCGTTLTLKDGYQAAGWQVEGSSFKWDKDAGLTLTQEMIDRVAKENELYKNTTFIALVEKETFTITIKEPGLADQTISVSAKDEFELPAPRKIPSGKTLKGIKVNDNDNDLKQPGDKIPAAQNTTITYVFENSGRSVKLSYKVSDPEGGKLSVTEEVVAPNAETVCGTTLTLKDGYQAAGWQVEGSSFKWDKDAGLTLTQEMIDRVAKENELYKNTTFIALVEKETFTITIKEPGLADQTISVSAKDEFELPAPRKIPSGKTLKGIKVNDNDNDLKQPGDKIPAAQNTTITYVFENNVKLEVHPFESNGATTGILSRILERVIPTVQKIENTGQVCSVNEKFDSAGEESSRKRDLSEVKNGWYKQDNKVYYYRNNTKVTSWQELSGTIQDPTSPEKHWFYFNASGVMLTGRHKLVGGIENNQGFQEEHWFAFDPTTGVGIRGWNPVTEDGIEKWYYYGKDGAGYIGRHWILGGFKNAQGLQEMNWFFFDRFTGVEIRGWHKIEEDGVVNWYYYRDGDGIMLKGQHELEGGFNHQFNWFYFDEITGIEIRGWKGIDYQNKWCYYGKDGAMLKGQYELRGGYNQGLNWFYFDEETGGEIRGWKEITSQNKWCYYYEDGTMLKGQHKLFGGYNQGLNWFYFDEETGAEIRGWKEIRSQNKLCYYGEDGAMLKGQHELVGGFDQKLNWFYFDEETGAEIHGWKEITYQNKWCYYGEDGAMLKGQHELFGGNDHQKNWFYFDEETGAEIRGWKYIGEQDKTCYYGKDGAMYKGWRTIGNKTYYFDEETGALC